MFPEGFTGTISGAILSAASLNSESEQAVSSRVSLVKKYFSLFLSAAKSLRRETVNLNSCCLNLSSLAFGVSLADQSFTSLNLLSNSVVNTVHLLFPVAPGANSSWKV